MKVSLAFFSLVLVVFSSGLLAQDMSDSPSSIRNLIQKNELIVGMVKQDQPPFFFLKNGQLVGFDVDLANGIAESLGVKVVFKRSADSFNRLIPQMLSGETDIVISKLSRTLSRSKFVKFTKPYISFRQSFMINRLGLAQYEKTHEEKLTYDFTKFKGRLGAIKNSSYVSYAKNYFPLAEIIEFDNWDKVVDAVFDNEVLVAYRDELEIKKIIKSRPDAGLKVQTVVFKDTKDDIAIAVRWYENGLLAFLNNYIDNIPKAEVDFLINKYLNLGEK